MMSSVSLFTLIDQQKNWLSARQSLIAQNVANVNTPGYKALDTLPFARVMENAALDMAGGHPLHLRPSPGETMAAATRLIDATESTHSGNTVSPEEEMVKASEIRGAFTLDNNLLRAFHAMWMTVAHSS
jgi:flagellar basal-body rod protein FlgB